MAKKTDLKKIKEAKKFEKERMYKPNPEDAPRPGVVIPQAGGLKPPAPKPEISPAGVEVGGCGNNGPRVNVGQLAKVDNELKRIAIADRTRLEAVTKRVENLEQLLQESIIKK